MIQHMGMTITNGQPFSYYCQGFGASWTGSLLLEGSLRKRYASGEERTITAPVLSVYDSNSRHEFHSVAPGHQLRSIWLIFGAPGYDPDRLFPVREAPGAWSISLAEAAEREEVIPLIEGMLEDWRSRKPYGQQLADNALERVFLRLANTSAQDGGVMDPRIRRALDFMQEHLREKITLSRMAREANLSPSRFSHLFAELNACTPQEYLEHLRMEEAKTMLLMQRVGMAEIAERTGFENQFYFSTRFRRRFGMSPLQFRKAGGIVR